MTIVAQSVFAHPKCPSQLAKGSRRGGKKGREGRKESESARKRERERGGKVQYSSRDERTEREVKAGEKEEKPRLDFSRQYIEGFSHRDHGDRMRQQRSVASRRRFPSEEGRTTVSRVLKARRILSGREQGGLAGRPTDRPGWLTSELRCRTERRGVLLVAGCGCTNRAGLNTTRGRNVTFAIRPAAVGVAATTVRPREPRAA